MRKINSDLADKLHYLLVRMFSPLMKHGGMKMTKAEKLPEDEVTTNFFGINPKTYEIESISLTRGGTLLRVKDGAANWSANVPVAAAKREIATRLGLVEIVETSALNAGEEQRRRIIEDLETKAEVMKQENSE